MDKGDECKDREYWIIKFVKRRERRQQMQRGIVL
jgi:hypothetical protein